MRHIYLLFAFLLAIAPISHTNAQRLAPQPQKPSRTDLNTILMSRYQAIAGAWFIETKCQFLEPEKRANFEKYVGALNAYAQNKGLAPTEHLLLMQKNGKMASELPKYSACKEDSENLVRPTFMLTEMLYQDLIVTKD